jgi:para-nitrobenzyl esterase
VRLARPLAALASVRRALILVACLFPGLMFTGPNASRERPRPRPSDPVRVQTGLLAGSLTADELVRVFRGIPYAAPPVGDLRWRPPQPPASWPGVRHADEFRPACAQPRTGERPLNTSEDCLYLNVWAPAHPGRRHVPVLVWFHGGGFSQGAASLPTFDGEWLARRGAVVVTFDYRLGPFGFLAHPALSSESGHNVSGNYGLLDQLAALRWVAANIKSFGGSPDRITVFGDSSGAASIGCLMLSSEGHGLFHAAILQDGTPLGVTRYLHDAPGGQESMEEVGELIARRLGCDREDDVAAALRAKSTDEVLTASHPAQVSFGEGIRFGPVIDQWLLSDRPEALLASKRVSRVPTIVGWSADAGTGLAASLGPVDADTYRRTLRAIFRDGADDVAARYPVARDGDGKAALARVLDYGAFAAPARRFAAGLARAGVRSYLYEFTPPRPATPRAAARYASDVPFVFGTVRSRPAEDTVDADRELSNTMMGYWLRLAAAGDPNGEDAPRWPRVRPPSIQLLDLGADVASRVAACSACDFFDRLAQPQRPRP